MNQGNELLVDQALHGYENGHGLLATSLSLPSSAERIMLILSDMSGSSMVQGFESYITGYPLIEVNKYVLARTWYAPEMHRPGCVWTHSLIIDFSDFASINNLQELCILFKRPLKGTAYIKSHYQNKLSMIFNEASNNFIDVSQPIALRLISSLYNSPSLPVFISTKNPSDFENTFFNIWNLQWPRLRRSVCFCPGSISCVRMKQNWLQTETEQDKPLV